MFALRRAVTAAVTPRVANATRQAASMTPSVIRPAAITTTRNAFYSSSAIEPRKTATVQRKQNKRKLFFSFSFISIMYIYKREKNDI